MILITGWTVFLRMVTWWAVQYFYEYRIFTEKSVIHVSYFFNGYFFVPLIFSL
mgnify:CR=1 FL=1